MLKELDKKRDGQTGRQTNYGHPNAITTRSASTCCSLGVYEIADPNIPHHNTERSRPSKNDTRPQKAEAQAQAQAQAKAKTEAKTQEEEEEQEQET